MHIKTKTNIYIFNDIHISTLIGTFSTAQIDMSMNNFQTVSNSEFDGNFPLQFWGIGGMGIDQYEQYLL